MIFDLHTHTTLSSCSIFDIHDMIDIAGNQGLHGVCITDHQTMDIRYHITEGPQANGVIVIFGMEYETPEGDFLIFGPYEDISKGMDGIELLKYVNSTQGTAIAAHPFRTNRQVNESLIRDGLCTIIESINGRNSVIENLKVDKWRKNYRLIETAGSDAHTPDELGAAVTHFTTPIQSRKDLIYALKNGLCQPEWRAYEKNALSS